MTDLLIVFLSCRVFETLLARYLPAGLKDRVTFLDYDVPRQEMEIARIIGSGQVTSDRL
ncbi:MAG: hypothetical protein AB1564_01075 [Chloroflexota bacterium]